MVLIKITNARKWGLLIKTLNYIVEEEEMNLDTEVKEGTNEEDEGKNWQIVKRDSERKFDETKTVPDIQSLNLKRKLVWNDEFSLNRLVAIQLFLIAFNCFYFTSYLILKLLTGDAMEESCFHNSGWGQTVTEEVSRPGMHYHFFCLFTTFFNIF